MTVRVVPVGTTGGPQPVGVGAARPTLEQLADVAGTAEAPVGVPLALQRGPDGVFRPVRVTGSTGGALQGYEHIQVAAQSVWTITHGLGRYPTAWSLYDDAGRECGGYTVQHLDVDTCRVSMDIPTAGLVRLI